MRTRDGVDGGGGGYGFWVWCRRKVVAVRAVDFSLWIAGWCDIECDITGRGRATFCLDKRNQRMRQRKKEVFFWLDARWILGAVIGWGIGGTGLVSGVVGVFGGGRMDIGGASEIEPMV